MPFRHLPKLALIVLLLVLSSCGSKTSYRFMDWLIAWTVDDYVQWDRDQQRYFDQQLDQHISWHQRSQLPRYSQLLRQLKEDIKLPLNPQKLHDQLEQMSGLWGDIMAELSPDMVYLLRSLSDDQVEDLHNEVRRQSNKNEQKYRLKDPEKLTKLRVKNAEKNARKLLGRLNNPQKQLIYEWAGQLQGSSTLWLDNKKSWDQQLAAALEHRAQPEFPQTIERLFVQPQSLWSAPYQQQMTANTERTIDLMLAIHGQMSDRQRRHINRELDQWIELCDELAAEFD